MIELLTSGFYTSIQDLGRFQYTNYGVPLSGVMDKNLSTFANLLVGNDNDEALLELTLAGPKLKFNSQTIIAVTAYKAKVFINGKPVKVNHQISINSGDILEVKNIQSRAYLAISGGFKTDLKLGSRSQYQFITESSKLTKGDTLDFEAQKPDFKKKHASLKINLSEYEQEVIYVYPLPEYHELNDEQKKYLIKKTFSISNQSNRMAYQINETFKNELKGISSKPVMPGTIQLTPEGKLIILMRDAQVTGGYPRIFQTSEKGLNILAQKSAQHKIKFKILNQYEVK